MSLQQFLQRELCCLHSWMFHRLSYSMPSAHAGAGGPASSSREKLQAGPVGRAVAAAVAKGDSYLATQ